MSEPHDHEIEVFNVALELPAGQRAAYLEVACAGDPALRQRLEALLAADNQAEEFPPKGNAAAKASLKLGVPAASDDDVVGQTIGRYKLLEKVGEGGCGVVYVAQQDEPVRRRVAMKVIKLGMDTKEVIARFEAERQALAMMDHPNIAKVLDAGATEVGRPYFVMELVRGIKITEYCDQNQLNTKERLTLLIEVCHAVQHAHQKGIIHRDLKPSNILVTLHDGVPVPKVIDFGIAKATEGRLTEETIYTQLHQFIGTPAYMSPEQAEMSGLDIDTRSDIYSLGVLLYELLAGVTPFDAKELMSCGLDAMRKIIREHEPMRPSTRFATLQAADLTITAKRRSTDATKLLHQLKGDLDWIVMKCLEKDRTRRYETANGLAMDIQRHLTDEPVVARPPNNFYRLQKLVRRNKVTFTAGIIVIAALMAGLGISTVAVVRIQRASQQIRQAKDDATEELRVSHLAEARALRTSSQAGRRFASLDAVRKAAAIRPDIAVRNEAIASLAVSDLRVAKEVILKGHAVDRLVGFDFNLEKYAVGEKDGSITIHTVTN
ncbi:MAG: serine/threonine-protein kinase, partial [Verrucomicrobiota bacterium]